MWLLNKFLTKVIRSGELVLDGPTKTYRYGSPREGHAPIHIAIKDKATTAKIARNPALGGGEAFMAGKLVIENDDIMSFLGLIAYNMRWDYSNETRVSLWKTQRLLSKFQQLNDAITSRKNVAHHYDLNDRLYDLFLDADRQYSCAYFTDDDGNSNDELGKAQKDKLAHIAAKLCLKPEHHVLDIGCGWGGLALYLNKVSGARVTGITLSVEQLKVARERAEAAGVCDRVKFELIDYRALEGRFDRVVSVGMFEHVGRPNYQTYFDCIRDFLVEDGIALVHTIARADGPGGNGPMDGQIYFPRRLCPCNFRNHAAC